MLLEVEGLNRQTTDRMHAPNPRQINLEIHGTFIPDTLYAKTSPDLSVGKAQSCQS